jgi:hypothetical protein
MKDDYIKQDGYYCIEGAGGGISHGSGSGINQEDHHLDEEKQENPYW